MTKLYQVIDNSVITGYYFDCPGCGSGHFVTVQPHQSANGASWSFNGSMDLPTFQPSILARIDFNANAGKPVQVCHLFVADGQLRFLSDSTHALAGQTVPMPSLPD